MSLEPRQDYTKNNHSSWKFERNGDQLTVSINIEAVIPVDFADKVLKDGIERKNKAVVVGDALSLDLVVGGLPKEAINDLGRILKKD